MLGLVPKHFFLEGKLIKFVIYPLTFTPKKKKRKKECGPRYWVEATNPSKRKIPFYLCFLTYQKNHLEKSKTLG